MGKRIIDRNYENIKEMSEEEIQTEIANLEKEITDFKKKIDDLEKGINRKERCGISASKEKGRKKEKEEEVSKREKRINNLKGYSKNKDQIDWIVDYREKLQKKLQEANNQLEESRKAYENAEKDLKDASDKLNDSDYTMTLDGNQYNDLQIKKENAERTMKEQESNIAKLEGDSGRINELQGKIGKCNLAWKTLFVNKTWDDIERISENDNKKYNREKTKDKKFIDGLKKHLAKSGKLNVEPTATKVEKNSKTATETIVAENQNEAPVAEAENIVEDNSNEAPVAEAEVENVVAENSNEAPVVEAETETIVAENQNEAESQGAEDDFMTDEEQAEMEDNIRAAMDQTPYVVRGGILSILSTLLEKLNNLYKKLKGQIKKLRDDRKEKGKNKPKGRKVNKKVEKQKEDERASNGQETTRNTHEGFMKKLNNGVNVTPVNNTKTVEESDREETTIENEGDERE